MFSFSKKNVKNWETKFGKFYCGLSSIKGRKMGGGRTHCLFFVGFFFPPILEAIIRDYMVNERMLCRDQAW